MKEWNIINIVVCVIVIEMINNTKQILKNMVNENLIAKIEINQELKNENEVQRTLTSKEQESLIEDSYNFEMDSYSNIGQRKACGPMYRGGSSSSNRFSVRYFFSHEGDNEKLFFERSGVYFTELSINGDLWKLREELRKLENGEVRVFNLVQGHYKRDWSMEETVKKSLRKDIGKCEEVSFSPGVTHCMSQEFSRII